jgi:hypothetical protein
MLALIFSVTGVHVEIAQTANICISLLVIALSYQLARTIWNESSAIAAAITVAVWPAGVWFSVSVLREPAIMLCAVCGFLCCARWLQSKSFVEGAKSMFWFGIGGLFPGGLFVGILGVLVVVGVTGFPKVLRTFRSGAIPTVPVVALSLATVIALTFAIGGITVVKVGSYEELSDAEYFQTKLQRERGGATFPTFVTQQTGAAMALVLPLRLFFFTGGPFLWNARSAEQLMAAIDGLLMLLLFMLMVLNLPTVWRNQSARAVLVLWLMFMTVFAAGTANFGTALRHRVKFAPELIALASPFLLRRSQRRDCPDTRSLATSKDNALKTSS